MIDENKRKEKMCLFFASDYHFEMISLPYINKNLEQNKKIIMLTENNLEETVEKVLSRINLVDEQKDKIRKIDWKDKDINKFKEVEDEDTLIFVKGKENYINHVNENIDTSEYKVEIVDCYDINEVQDKVSSIVKKYDKILSTSGVEKLL